MELAQALANYRVVALEVTAQPLRLNRHDLVAIYTSALLHSPNVLTVPVGFSIARQAAELRAKFNVRTPDAIQVATAVNVGAQAFVTNDEHLRRVQGLPILVVADFSQDAPGGATPRP